MTSRLGGYAGRHHWGMLATFIALGGTAYAAVELPANSVGTRQIKPNAVTLTKINPTARSSLQHPAGPAGGDLTGRYPNPTIKLGAVTANKLAAPAAETPVSYNVTHATASSGGWEDYGSPYGRAAYYRDTEGVVHLSGVSKSYMFLEFPPEPSPSQQDLCGMGNDSTMFTLPPRDRPAAREIFAVESNNAHGRVDVAPDGEVICISGEGDQYVSLDGINFRAGG